MHCGFVSLKTKQKVDEHLKTCTTVSMDYESISIETRRVTSFDF